VSLRRWLKSTSNRTFIVWPLVLAAAEALLQQGVPAIQWWGVPLLAWGYLQYRFVGNYRADTGGGGPGISVPPDRIVQSGPYRWVRNPMYLGHLIFFAGLAITLASWIALAVFVFHAFWFDRRVREDEERLAGLFGDSYREYCRRVKRWIPGLV
jgi:protein-S-isoprenylcysteine O-methyltransferase Ste14